MNAMLRLLSPNGTIGRLPYLGLGLLFLVLKFPIDWSVARAFGVRWTALNYLVWPGHDTLVLWELGAEERSLALSLLAVALPFIWIGVTLTLQRLRDARLPLPLVVTFFVPLLNLPFLLWLCCEPTRLPDPGPDTELPPDRRAAVLEVLRARRPGVRTLVALLAGGAITVGVTLLSVNALASYGLGLFIAAPFVQGIIVALLLGIGRPASIGTCVVGALVSEMIGGAAILLVGIDGLGCLVMAAPLLLGVGALGGVVGYAIQAGVWQSVAPGSIVIALALLLPALVAAERAVLPPPRLRAVETSVIVNLPPELVWRHVISFPPLPEPTEWYFRAGIAYPVRADIHGHGCGAVRHCVFSTGAFVEPIDVWDEPTRLAFRVTDQPPPMREFSPYEIDPPHLHGFLESQRGEFRLEPLDGGHRTRLVGTTWYTNRMWPSAYWGAWSDSIIHRIHARVLEHVRTNAEASAKSSS